MIRLLMIADDLTGAADAGVCFAGRGLSTTISLSETPLPDVDILIRNTQSRDIDVARAVQFVQQAVTPIAPEFVKGTPHWVYMKIDSALRGHPREELRAIMTVLGERRALIAPALPSERRTTVGGRQLINGVPVEKSEFGVESRVSDLTALFAPDGDDEMEVYLLELQTVRQGPTEVARFLRDVPSENRLVVVVADAETDADLFTLACAGVKSDLRALAGSAGLARQLARALPLVPELSAGEVMPQHQGPVLIVAGSQHLATARQVECLRGAGYPIIRLDQAHIDELTATIDGAVDELAANLAAGRSAVLTTTGLNPSAHGPAFVVQRLADAAATVVARGDVGGLVLTGGDVASGVLSRMGSTALHLRGEIRPAIPWGIIESSEFPPIHVATKAGSFGAEDALLACAEFLESAMTDTDSAEHSTS